MIPKRVVLENFLSFGPKTAIEFTDDEKLWVLGGPNGVGKSAVFDAITFCLFGAHRGGAKEIDPLIRHGANGFSVMFEFEFGGRDYRITRNRSGNRTTQSVEQRQPDADTWERVPNVNSVSGVKEWSEKTLGLGFDAFRASVLLRQGEADKIISAGGTERLNILKKIIGAERYEQLSGRVHEARKARATELKQLQTRRDGAVEVTEAELQAAQLALDTAAARREESRLAATAAAERVSQARQWTKCEADRERLARQIHEADARAADGSLTRQRESLSKLTSERDALAAAAAQAKQKAESHRLAVEHHGREAKRLGDEIERDSKSITAADGVTALKSQLATQFPAELDALLSSAGVAASTATAALEAARAEKNELAGLLKRARLHAKEFAAVGVGVECSRCGQPVTAEHAENERRKLAEDVAALERRSADAEQREHAAKTASDAAGAEQRRLQQLNQQRETVRALLTQKERDLAALGIAGTSAELRRQLDAKRDQQAAHSREESTASTDRDAATNEATRLERDHRVRAKDCTALEQQVREAEQRLAQDAALRTEWANQLAEVERTATNIPEAARLAESVALSQASAAATAAAAAEKDRDAAKTAAETLGRRAAEYRDLLESVALAELADRRHDKLDKLLGNAGLLKELVDTAQRDIVRSADDTVRNLSDGELSILLDENSKEAFALLVQQADRTAPTPIDYLSGSQKFRVAISVALAIGRFAAGQARPLECVIIDEGFGSLDKDGLRAAADELNRLKQHLRRIVLVSHQDEFTDHFPVVIRLSKGDAGTTATSVRR